MTEDQMQLQMLLYEATDIQEDIIRLRLQQQPHGDRPESQAILKRRVEQIAVLKRRVEHFAGPVPSFGKGSAGSRIHQRGQ